MKSTFPEYGFGHNEIIAALENIETTLKPINKMGLRIYGTDPHPIALEAIYKFLRFNHNNIGTHTGGELNYGMNRLESEVVFMLGNLMGLSEVDGYITQGGTEGNITGLWIGRNKLRGVKNKICLFKTDLTHYSVDKGADLLDLKSVENIPLNRDFGMDAAELEKKILARLKDGYRHFLIILTLGYNTTGTIDPVDEINATLDRLQRENPSIETYIHLDGAIGGLVYPFVSKKNFGFEWPIIQSISLDMHKTGFVPHTAGIFLARKNLQKYIERPVAYLRNGKDNTLSGSRPAVAAAACWSVIKHLGRSGFRKIIEKEFEQKNYFHNLLKQHQEILSPILIGDEAINISAFHFQKNTAGGILDANLEKNFGLKPFKLNYRNRTLPFYTIVFMPHITNDALLKLISAASEKRGNFYIN